MEVAKNPLQGSSGRLQRMKGRLVHDHESTTHHMRSTVRSASTVHALSTPQAHARRSTPAQAPGGTRRALALTAQPQWRAALQARELESVQPSKREARDIL